MQQIDRAARGIVLAVDDHHLLRDTITDGDIRRAILHGIGLDQPLQDLLQHKAQRQSRAVSTPSPIVGRVGQSRQHHILLMQQTGVRHLPVLDDGGRVVDLVCLDACARSQETLDVQAVIMAGGFGSRLRPLTDDTPKPMLPIAGRPLMERTIQQLRDAGIRRINITTHYLPDKITGHFGSGVQFGVQLNYVAEHQPLGTAGALGLVDQSQDPLLVINGDILTRVDYRAMLQFHRQRGAQLTVGVRQYDLQVPYGVVEAEDGRVRSLREKPKLNFFVNAGIYLLEPDVRQFIPPDQRFDMTDLIEMLLTREGYVASFPIVEYWLDIGQPEDFQQAQADVAQMRWAS
jgi:dTDP-glucose pyrophosphorylase